MLNTQIGSKVTISGYAKKGSQRLAPGEKRGGTKWTYGNDIVDLTLEIANYGEILKADMEALKNADMQMVLNICETRGYTCWTGRGRNAVERPLTLNDLFEGYAALQTKTEKSQLRYENDIKSPQQAPYSPLAHGVKQHRDSGIAYVQGLLIDEQVVTPAEHGSLPRSKSGGKAVAERVISRILGLQGRKWRMFDMTKGQISVL